MITSLCFVCAPTHARADSTVINVTGGGEDDDGDFVFEDPSDDTDDEVDVDAI